jgi:Ca2+-binding EF-hand superfamily protein
LLQTAKNKDIVHKMKEIELALMERFSNNWVSVRKAFLDLDLDHDGYLTAEDFAKLVGGSAGSSKFDYNILKMLINIRILN